MIKKSSSLVLYVQAGPNGTGKSTSYDLYIPENVEYINTDEISRRIKLEHPNLHNTQEQANAEATRLFNELIIAKKSYAFETNLYDVDTWKFIEKHQALGYTIRMNFFNVDSIEELNRRVLERKRNKGHFVYPDIVRERYLLGLKLLEKYYAIPDQLEIVDSSKKEHKVLITMKKGRIIYRDNKLTDSMKVFLNNISQVHKSQKISSVDEAREQYQKIKNKSRGMSL